MLKIRVSAVQLRLCPVLRIAGNALFFGVVGAITCWHFSWLQLGASARSSALCSAFCSASLGDRRWGAPYAVPQVLGNHEVVLFRYPRAVSKPCVYGVSWVRLFPLCGAAPAERLEHVAPRLHPGPFHDRTHPPAEIVPGEGYDALLAFRGRVKGVL